MLHLNLLHRLYLKPAADSEAPQSRAVIACGSLECNTINSQLCFVDSPFNRIETTSLKGIFTEPMNRLSSSSNAIATDIKITAVFTFLFILNQSFNFENAVNIWSAYFLETGMCGAPFISNSANSPSSLSFCIILIFFKFTM